MENQHVAFELRIKYTMDGGELRCEGEGLFSEIPVPDSAAVDYANARLNMIVMAVTQEIVEFSTDRDDAYWMIDELTKCVWERAEESIVKRYGEGRAAGKGCDNGKSV